MIVIVLVFVFAGLLSAYGVSKIDATPSSPTFSFTEKKVPLMNRYRLVCRTERLEVQFTIDGFKTLQEAQDMLDILNEGRPKADCAWEIEPLLYN